MCVTHILPGLGHRRAKLQIVIRETKYEKKKRETKYDTKIVTHAFQQKVLYSKR